MQFLEGPKLQHGDNITILASYHLREAAFSGDAELFSRVMQQVASLTYTHPRTGQAIHPYAERVEAFERTFVVPGRTEYAVLEPRTLAAQIEDAKQDYADKTVALVENTKVMALVYSGDAKPKGKEPHWHVRTAA